jgi:hypothetical protein
MKYNFNKYDISKININLSNTTTIFYYLYTRNNINSLKFYDYIVICIIMKHILK